MSGRGAASALVPQGREIFPLLTVKENLETGFAPLGREHNPG
jgi:urea transport system ATP-binding protein